MFRQKLLPLFLLIPVLAPAGYASTRVASSTHTRHATHLTHTGHARTARAIDAILAKQPAAQAHWGISITTLDGRPIYARNDAQLFIPASNTKLLTTSASLALFGPDMTIVTPVIANSGPDANGILHGDLTLMGAGDPSMSEVVYPYNGHMVTTNAPLAALASMVDQIYAHGVRHIQGNIVGDDTAFPFERYGSGWAWDDLLWDDGAPATGVTLNDNVIHLTVTPGAQPGEPVTISSNPDIPYYKIENTARTSAAGSARSLGVDRLLGSMDLRIFGTLPLGGPPQHLGIAIQDPAQYAAIALKQMLIARGITVTGDAMARHRPSTDTAIYEESALRPVALPPSNAVAAHLQVAPTLLPTVVTLASHTSVPLLEDITLTNKVSQNLHAELLLRKLGRQYGADGSIVEGARVRRSFLMRAGVNPDDLFFYDGSGMSGQDVIAPRALTQLLRYIAAQPWGAEYRATLPIGGVDGTLSDRFEHTSLKGHVFAKTGTLNEVNTLSGYVTARSGRTLVISVMCNGHLPHVRGTTKIIDAVVEAAAATN